MRNNVTADTSSVFAKRTDNNPNTVPPTSNTARADQMRMAPLVCVGMFHSAYAERSNIEAATRWVMMDSTGLGGARGRRAPWVAVGVDRFADADRLGNRNVPAW